MMQNKRQWKRLVTTSSALVLWGSMVAIWIFTWASSYENVIIRPFGYKGNWLVYGLYGVILLCFTIVYGGYRVGHYKPGDVLFSNILAMVFTNGITYAQTCLVGRAIMNPMPIIWMSIVDIVLIWIWTSLSFKLYLKFNPPHDMLVIYGGNRAAESLVYKMTSRSEKYNICQVVSIEEGLDHIYSLILDYNSVIICDVSAEYRSELLKYCFNHSVRTYFTPKISDIIVRGATNMNLFDTPLLLCKNRGLTTSQRVAKRALDIVVSLVGIILSAPLMLLVSIAIKMQDGGPVLFRQNRLTENGRIFRLNKFRSMIVEAEKDGIARLATQGDSRITSIGRFIRATRLDELPQLFNVLRGEMSIVGPRPERPEIESDYQAEMPEFQFRLKVKAGLTGYAQIVGKYNSTPYDKLKMDLMYIENYSIFEDIKLILMTLKIIFKRESTEGVKEKVHRS